MTLVWVFGLLSVPSISLGFFLSYRAGKRSGAKQQAEQAKAQCPCTHTIGEHHQSGRCLAQVRRPYYNAFGHRSGFQYVSCACVKYFGPSPIDQFFVPGMYVQ